MNGLEKQYGDRITFIRVDILLPGSRPMMDQYGFSAAPEFYLVDGHGKTLGAWDDLVQAKILRQAFEEAIRKSP